MALYFWIILSSAKPAAAPARVAEAGRFTRFIHFEHFYSAPSRRLLRSQDDESRWCLRGVPNQASAGFPWNEGDAIWSFAVRSEQALRFLLSWESSFDQGSVN